VNVPRRSHFSPREVCHHRREQWRGIESINRAPFWHIRCCDTYIIDNNPIPVSGFGKENQKEKHAEAYRYDLCLCNDDYRRVWRRNNLLRQGNETGRGGATLPRVVSRHGMEREFVGDVRSYGKQLAR